MRTFRFPLQPVLDHRQRIEDTKKQTVAQRQRTYDAARAELRRLNEEFREGARRLREDHRSLTTEELRANYAHVQFLDRAIDAQIRVVADRQAALDRARNDLLEASKERKVVEKLKERRQESFVSEERRLEQNEIDDGNARRYGRSANVGGMP